MYRKTISLIIPCYNEEEVLPLFYEEISRVINLLNKYAFELIFVNDGSRDQTLSVIKSFSSSSFQIRYLSFSRNFGKEAAIYAGLKASRGEYVSLMDADLQDPPEMLIEMTNIIENEPYDCVGVRRVTRKGEPPIRSFFARKFYKMMNKYTQTEIVDGARDFRLMTRKMVNAVLEVEEYHRFSKGIFSWVGFKTKWLEYKNVKRAKGQTKWSFWKLFKYSLEGIISFTTIPLSIMTVLGFIFTIVAFLFIVFIVVRKLVWSGTSVEGWSSTISIMLMLSGIILLALGVQGQYIAKIHLEVKKRPIYILSESSDEVIKSVEHEENP